MGRDSQVRVVEGRVWLGVALGIASLGVGLTPVDAAEGLSAPLRVDLKCPERQGPGRVVCTATVASTAPDREVLRWVDVLVLSAPEFARPLRARIRSNLQEEGAPRVELKIPLYAEAANTGLLRVRARATLCAAEARNERCRPATREVEAAIAVKSAD